jgi:hypothetical protein
VERLTGDQGHDPFFVQSFLLTLHSFSSPDELIDLLVRRYTHSHTPTTTPLASFRPN